MIDQRAEASAVQTPVICREIVQMLRDVVLARPQTTRARE